MGVLTRAQKRRLQEAKSQEPACPDLISLLPDGVLGDIISRLPTKDAARTQIFSSRWRHLWRSALLNLDDVDLFGEIVVRYCTLILDEDERNGVNDARVGIISHFVSTHPGPGRRLYLPSIPLKHRYSIFDAWFQSPALNNLQEHDFRYYIEFRYRPMPPHPFPPSMLRFAPTLRVAYIGCFHFPNDIAPLLNFFHLKDLTLVDVIISEGAIHALRSSCPVLESLLLDYNASYRCLRIRSATLRSIGAFARTHETGVKFQELVIEDDHSLERLVPFDPDDGPSIIREMLHVSLTASLRNVKILVLHADGPNIDSVVGSEMLSLLGEAVPVHQGDKSSLLIEVGNFQNEWLYDPLDPIECLEFHLKKSSVAELSRQEARC